MNGYNEIINSEEVYMAIAKNLKTDKAVLIGWSDEKMTHFDILFTYQPIADVRQILNGTMIGDEFLSGSFQGGICPSDLFVSIMRVGCFGFDVKHTNTNSGYYDEKLSGRLQIGKTTSEKLAELINGIKKNLISKKD